MNTLSDLHPGKLKRKNKKSPNTSVVDMPAAASQPVTGNLLGDMFVDSESAFSNDSPVNDSPAAESAAPAAEIKSFDFKGLSDDSDDADPSPLDLLGSSSPSKIDLSPVESRSQDSLLPLRLQKKNNKQQPQAQEQLPTHADIARFNELLAETRDLHQKCIDTLTKLQNANVQNEKRYAIYITIAFVIMAILTCGGVIVGTNLKNNAHNSELKLKLTSCSAALENNSLIKDAYDKDIRGSKAAFDVFQKIDNGNYEDAIENFSEVRDQLTHPAESALLEAKIDEIRYKLAESAFNDGVMLYNAANFDQARDAFFKSRSYKDNTPNTPKLNYYYAMSLYQLGEFEAARRAFALISASDLSPEMDALARYYRAVCAEKTGNTSEAYEQFDQFLKKYRNHKFADDASKRRAKAEKR